MADVAATNQTPFCVAALYKFVRLDDLTTFQAGLRDVCEEQGVTGTLLLASEGINGTIAGSDEGIANVLSWLRKRNEIGDLDVKFSRAREQPFLRMKVRLKKEIVTLGAGDIDPANNAGTYVQPEDWNALISDPDVVVVDTRNAYEVAIGTFKDAVDPLTTSFKEFPDWVDEKLEADPDTKIAMFCTGGIRCEKSTALMKAKGYNNVYHLQGGILKYLETVPEDESLWEGDCFVFDNRVSVKHGLVQGDYDLCHACRMPISEEDMASADYVKGVSCPHCIHSISPETRERFAERQKQIELAAARHEEHLAADLAEARARKKQEREAQRERSSKGESKAEVSA